MSKFEKVHRVVLDTNVIVSAMGWRGPPRGILEQCIEGKLELLTSPALFAELTKVLEREKFHFIPREEREEFCLLFLELATVVEPDFVIDIIAEDDADNRVLECAVAGGADFIITGDKHLLTLKNYEQIQIIKPARFMSKNR